MRRRQLTVERLDVVDGRNRRAEEGVGGDVEVFEADVLGQAGVVLVEVVVQLEDELGVQL